MATLKPFTSSTLEGAFLEAAFLLEKGEIERNYANKPEDDSKPWNKLSFITITINTDTQRVVITATLPIRVESNSFGGRLLVEEFISDSFVYDT